VGDILNNSGLSANQREESLTASPINVQTFNVVTF